MLLLIGATAILGSIPVRYSSWARERRLKVLTVDELALAVHDAPQDTLTWLYYAGALMKAGDLPDAESAFQRAAMLSPRDTRARLGLGATRIRMGNPVGAQQALEPVVQQEPRNTAALVGLSQAYYQQGYVGKATDCLDKVVAIEPRNATAWYHLGRIAGEANQRDKALVSLQTCVRIDPKLGEAWSDLGYLSLFYGNYDDAQKQLEEAIRLRRNDPLNYYRLGLLYLRLPDTPQNRGYAEATLLSAIQRDPNLADAYSQLGQLYERRGQTALAITNLRKACSLDDSDEHALYHLGRCLLKAGSAAEGNKLINASHEMGAAKEERNTLRLRIIAQPKSRPLRLRLARLYRRYGNLEGAMGAYRTYMQLGPPDSTVQKEMEACAAELRRAAAPPRTTQSASP